MNKIKSITNVFSNNKVLHFLQFYKIPSKTNTYFKDKLKQLINADKRVQKKILY